MFTKPVNVWKPSLYLTSLIEVLPKFCGATAFNASLPVASTTKSSVKFKPNGDSFLPLPVIGPLTCTRAPLASNSLSLVSV